GKNSNRMSEVDPESLWLKRAKSIVLSCVHWLLEFVKRSELVEIVSLLSLFIAVIFGFPDWLFQAASYLCLLLFLLFPKTIRSSLFWLALAPFRDGSGRP